MNETLYVEPAHPVIEDDFVVGLEQYVPEHINPDWHDDALYDLICANQDVLVEVDGCVITLSDAMNRHPGPWTPENEVNLIAYAESLLAAGLTDLTVYEAPRPEEVIEEPPLDPRQPDVVLAVHDTVHQVQVEDAPEKLTSPYDVPTLTVPETTANLSEPVMTRVHVDGTIDADIGIAEQHDMPVDDPEVYTDEPETVHRPAECENGIDMSDDVQPPTSTNEVEELPVREVHVPVEMAEIIAVVDEDDEATIDATRSDETDEPVDMAGSETPVEVDVPLSESAQIPSDVASGPVFDEMPPGLPLEDCVEILLTEPVTEIQPASIEPIDVAAEEVGSALMQLVELIGSDIAEDDDEGVMTTVNDIIEAPATLEVETKEEWAVFYVEVFDAAGIAYTPELIERLSALTARRNLFKEIEAPVDSEGDTDEGKDASTRVLVKKLLVATVHMTQAVRHIHAIGTYALRLSLVSRVDYR